MLKSPTPCRRSASCLSLTDVNAVQAVMSLSKIVLLGGGGQISCPPLEGCLEVSEDFPLFLCDTGDSKWGNSHSPAGWLAEYVESHQTLTVIPFRIGLASLHRKVHCLLWQRQPPRRSCSSLDIRRDSKGCPTNPSEQSVGL